MSLVYSFIKIQLGYLHAVLQSRMFLLSIHMARRPGFLLLLSRLGYCSILSSELHRCNLFPLLHTQKPSARIVLDYVMHPFAFLPFLFCISYILLLFPFTREEKSLLHFIPVIPISSRSVSRYGLTPSPGPEYHFTN